MICPKLTSFPGAQRGIPMASPLGVFFGLVLENSSSLPWREAELELLSQISQLVFCQGEYFQKGVHLGLGRAVLIPKGWFGLNVGLLVPASWEELLPQCDALVTSRV